MSGSGQDTPVSYTQATSAPESGGISEFLQNKNFQKYLTDLGAGMAGQPNFNVAMGAGLKNAGAGLSESLGREAETERLKKLKEEERQRQVELIKNIIGNDGQLSPDLFNDPRTAMTAGMKLISSGDPTLMEQGKNIMAIGSSLQKSEPDQWVTTSQNIGGKDIPVQINAKTGEVKPYSPDIINGPQVSYVPELRTFVDKYGNPVTPGQGQPQGQQAPISQFTNQSIGTTTAPAGTLPTTTPTAPVPTLPAYVDNPLLNPGENAKAREAYQAAQLGLQTESAKKKMETQQKQIDEATNYFSPDNQQVIASQREQTKGLVTDLENQIGPAHAIWGSNLKPAQTAMKNLGFEGVSNLEATSKALIESKIREMKAAGVMVAGQLNSDKDVDTLAASIFDPTANEATQKKQLSRLKESLSEADRLIAAKEQKFKGYLGQSSESNKETPKEIVDSTNPKDYTEGSVHLNSKTGKKSKVVNGRLVPI